MAIGRTSIHGLIALAAVAVLGLWPASAEAVQHAITCPARRIANAIKHLKPGDTLTVSGTCSENVVVGEDVQNVTIQGAAGATINASDAASPAIEVLGRGVILRGFTINGGFVGVRVTGGGTAVIDGNTIQGGAGGVAITQNSYAKVVNNTIQNTAFNGIAVLEGSSARIGFHEFTDAAASPNTIQNNLVGVFVLRGAHAFIAGNTIRLNSFRGIHVRQAAHAAISGNTIDANGGGGTSEGGIVVEEASTINLPEGQTGLLGVDNVTTSNQENNPVAIRCMTRGLVSSQGFGIGGLTGSVTDTDFDATTCLDNT